MNITFLEISKSRKTNKILVQLSRNLLPGHTNWNTAEKWYKSNWIEQNSFIRHLENSKCCISISFLYMCTTYTNVLVLLYAYMFSVLHLFSVLHMFSYYQWFGFFQTASQFRKGSNNSWGHLTFNAGWRCQLEHRNEPIRTVYYSYNEGWRGNGSICFFIQ